MKKRQKKIVNFLLSNIKMSVARFVYEANESGDSKFLLGLLGIFPNLTFGLCPSEIGLKDLQTKMNIKGGIIIV